MGLTWRAGAATAALPVQIGTGLSGYGKRTAPVSGTLRPLEANVLAIAAGASTAVVVTLDLLAIDAGWVRALRGRLRAEHGIRPELVLVAASHTHAGPAGFRRVGAPGSFDAPERWLRRNVLDTVTAAARTALGDLRPAQLRISSTTCSVAAHRGDPSKPVDERLTRLDVVGDGEQPLAVLWHYACHATVLAADNTLVSPDLPGEVRAELRDRYRATLPVLYLNGAAADVSTRFTRRAQTPNELRRLGRLVAVAMPVAVIPLTPAAPMGRLARCPLQVADEDPAAVAGRLESAREAYKRATSSVKPARLRVLDTAVLGLEKRLARCRASAGHSRSRLIAAVQVIDLGDLALVGIPGELYTEQGREIRDGSGRLYGLAVGYSGDYLGYLPPVGEVGGYEADSAVVAAGAGSQLAEAALDLLRAGARQ